MNQKENISKEQQQLSETNDILNKVNRKKFRLYHAIFHDSLRRPLLSLYVSKDRRDQIDAQNTVAPPPCFFELVSNLYNDPSWVPHTLLFPDFDARFRAAIQLPLPG